MPPRAEPSSGPFAAATGRQRSSVTGTATVAEFHPTVFVAIGAFGQRVATDLRGRLREHFKEIPRFIAILEVRLKPAAAAQAAIDELAPDADLELTVGESTEDLGPAMFSPPGHDRISQALIWAEKKISEYVTNQGLQSYRNGRVSLNHREVFVIAAPNELSSASLVGAPVRRAHVEDGTIRYHGVFWDLLSPTLTAAESLVAEDRSTKFRKELQDYLYPDPSLRSSTPKPERLQKPEPKPEKDGATGAANQKVAAFNSVTFFFRPTDGGRRSFLPDAASSLVATLLGYIVASEFGLGFHAATRTPQGTLLLSFGFSCFFFDKEKIYQALVARWKEKACQLLNRPAVGPADQPLASAPLIEPRALDRQPPIAGYMQRYLSTAFKEPLPSLDSSAATHSFQAKGFFSRAETTWSEVLDQLQRARSYWDAEYREAYRTFMLAPRTPPTASMAASAPDITTPSAVPLPRQDPAPKPSPLNLPSISTTAETGINSSAKARSSGFFSIFRRPAPPPAPPPVTAPTPSPPPVTTPTPPPAPPPKAETAQPPKGLDRVYHCFDLIAPEDESYPQLPIDEPGAAKRPPDERHGFFWPATVEVNRWLDHLLSLRSRVEATRPAEVGASTGFRLSALSRGDLDRFFETEIRNSAETGGNAEAAAEVDIEIGDALQREFERKFQGKTFSDAFKHSAAAFEEWLEQLAAEQVNAFTPELPQDILDALERGSGRSGIAPYDFIENALVAAPFLWDTKAYPHPGRPQDFMISGEEWWNPLQARYEKRSQIMQHQRGNVAGEMAIIRVRVGPFPPDPKKAPHNQDPPPSAPTPTTGNPDPEVTQSACS